MTDAPLVADALRIIRGDNLAALGSIPDAAVRLIYVDPPFNTGVRRGRRRLRTVRDDAGGRVGFGGE
ncbi:MAG TPA: hypothetical protein VLA95_03510, partial [Gemmatimonadales bacterium]|nr:hypothetical protein [Gemmatimonadales bacterium]